MPIAREEKLAQLDKILRGRTLHGSESLKAFLRFVVDKSIDNHEGQLKEYVIATEVFGRGSDFDSRVDSVVRVQAGRLRAKLHEYYETEGKDDSLIIDLPKGQYTPVFYYAQKKEGWKTDSGMAASAVSEPYIIPNPSGAAPAMAETSIGYANGSPLEAEFARAPRGLTQASGVGLLAPPKFWQMATLVFAFLAVMLGGLAFYYRARAVEPSNSVKVESEAIDRSEIDPLWGDLLRSSEPVLVVYSNTLFQGTAEEGMKLLKPLDAPGSSLGSPIIPQSEIKQSGQPVIEHYTGIGEVMGAYFLGDFLARVGHASRVKRSLLLTWEDLKTENIIVLGSPAENFFLRDLPQKQDFIFKPMPDENGKQTFGVINVNPRPGEQRRYFAKQDGPSRSQISEDYAVVSLLQGLDGKKRMLILAGITTLGTQAATEYVTKPDYIRDLINHLNTAPSGAPPKLPENFQALVKVKVNGGVPVHVSYVTHHRL
jgi:hypothetical protein